MALRIVGAGVGRTGTESLKLALEQLLGGPCYHMLEVLSRPERMASWIAAGGSDPTDWNEVFAGYVAAVDWPAAAFWREISEAFPDAPVLLSTRADADQWYKSARETIFAQDLSKMPLPGAVEFFGSFFGRFGADPTDPDSAKAAYEAHNAAVREAVPPGRLIDWQPGDGWGPICAALGIDEPDQPFPHVNTTEMFKARIEAGLGGAQDKP